MLRFNYSTKMGPWCALFLHTSEYFTFSGHNFCYKGLFVLFQEVDLVIGFSNSIIVFCTFYVKKCHNIFLLVSRG